MDASTGTHVAGRPLPATIPKRLIASVLDILSWSIPLFGMQALLLAHIRSIPRESCGVDACAMMALSVIFGLPMLAFPVVAFGYLLVQIAGVSPGLWLTSVRIVNADGHVPGWRGLVRFVVPLSFASTAAVGLLTAYQWTVDGSAQRTAAGGLALLLVVLPHLWALWEPERRTLQDLAAGTWVVRRRTAPTSPAPIEEPASSTM
ncbi:MAG: RDD family protein [Chloroflexota bacterium]